MWFLPWNVTTKPFKKHQYKITFCPLGNYIDLISGDNHPKQIHDEKITTKSQPTDMSDDKAI